MRPAYFGVLCLGLSLVGCDTSDLHDEEVGDLVLSVVADEVRLATVEEYSCSNYPLAVDVDTETKRVSIKVKGIGEVEGCRTALGPAHVTVPSPDLIPYEIAIEKDGRIDRFDYACGFAGCFLHPVGEPEFTRIGP